MEAKQKIHLDLGSTLHLFYTDAYSHPEGLSKKEQIDENMQALFDKHAFTDPAELRFLAGQLEALHTDNCISPQNKKTLFECLIKFFPLPKNASFQKDEDARGACDLLAVKSLVWLKARELEVAKMT